MTNETNEKGEEVWNKPKHPAASSIQVGNIQVPIDNIFQDLNNATDGRDLFPSGIT